MANDLGHDRLSMYGSRARRLSRMPRLMKFRLPLRLPNGAQEFRPTPEEDFPIQDSSL